MDDEEQDNQDLFTVQPTIREWFNKGLDYRVTSFDITDRTAYILSSQGELTAEDDQRTSKTICQAARHGQACSSTFLTVCKSNSTIAVVSLSYPQSSGDAQRHRQRPNDVVFVRRTDGSATGVPNALVATLIPQLSGAPLTAAAWLGQQALLATSEGDCHVFDCRNPSREPPDFAVRPKAFNLMSFRRSVTSIAIVNDTVVDDEEPEGVDVVARLAGKRCILMSTANALFCFTGEGTLSDILVQYDSAASVYKALAIELPPEANEQPSRLALREGIADREVDTQQLAWLTQTILVIADLDVSPGVVDGGWDLIVKKASVRRVDLSEVTGGGDVKGLATTQWRVLLLEPQPAVGGPPRVNVVNRITGRCMSRVVLPSALGTPFGLFFDPVWEEVYLCGSKGYTQVTEAAAELHVWQDFLALERYDDALTHADGDPAATARVLLRWGERLLKDERFVEAAEKFGAIGADMSRFDGVPTFTQLVLRFYPDPSCSHLDAAKAEGLERYLETKLLPYRHKAQADANASAVATWMLELLCDRLTNAVMESTHSPDPARADAGGVLVAELERRLAAFIDAYSAQLEYNVLISNLDSFGRVKEMKLAARKARRWHELISYHLAQGEVRDALELVEKLEGAELEAALSELMRLDPRATAKALRTYPGLQAVEPGRILRAAVQFGTLEAPPATRDEVIGLLEHLVYTRRNADRDVHNLYVTLLAMSADANKLLQFMETKEAQRPDNPNEYVFDPVFALHVAKEHGNMGACIKLMMGLNMMEDAIQLASTYSERLRIIYEVQARPMQQKLWRKVVEMEVQGARERAASDRETILSITRCVNDSQEALRIEDVLHLFPANATIDDYKEPLLLHMEAASRRVEQKKQDTASATKMSSALQRQLHQLQDVRGSISLDDACSSCRSKLGARPVCDLPYKGAVPPFIVYPSGGKYHTVCAVHRLMQSTVDRARQTRLRRLLEDLNGASKDATHVTTSDGRLENVDKLKDQLHRELEDGDPMNSEAVVQLIERLYGDDSAEAASWEVPVTVF